MRKLGWWIVTGALVVFNGILLWQVQSLSQTLKFVVGDEARLTILEGRLTDAQGIYTLPTAGQWFLPPEVASTKAPLNMIIFLSSKMDCPMNLSEFDVFKRLVPLFEERGQRIAAVCSPEDSAYITQLLDSAALSIPLNQAESEQFTFSQMGISPGFMPFKVLYDSNYTAIYMRGGDNNSQSQGDFEAAARRLSLLAWEGHI